jgi:hypothetical protein
MISKISINIEIIIIIEYYQGKHFHHEDAKYFYLKDKSSFVWSGNLFLFLVILIQVKKN